MKMEIFSLPEVASRVLLFADFASLLTLRGVNKQLSSFVGECTPLFCERDSLPVVKSFFHWALMYSKANTTCYSKLFVSSNPYHTRSCHGCSSSCIKDQLVQLNDLLCKGDFETALTFITPDILTEELFASFFEMFGENDECMQWVQTLLNITPEQEDTGVCSLQHLTSRTFNHYEAAFAGALRCDNSSLLISKIWSKEMCEKVSKDKALDLIVSSCNGTLDLFYTIDQLYPNLYLLEQTISSPPESWFIKCLAKDLKWSGLLLSLALREEDIPRYNFLFSLGLKCTSSMLAFCKTMPALRWFCDHIEIDHKPDNYYYFEINCTELRVDKLLRQLVKIKCTGDELESFLTRYSITSLRGCNLLLTETFFQFETFLGHVDDKWYSNEMSIGHLLLLQYYDREKFNLTRLIESGSATFDTLRFVLERDSKDVDWDKLIEAYFCSECTTPEILSLLLEKDVAMNDFAQGLPSRWKYDKEKANERNKKYQIVM